MQAAWPARSGAGQGRCPRRSPGLARPWGRCGTSTARFPPLAALSRQRDHPWECQVLAKPIENPDEAEAFRLANEAIRLSVGGDLEGALAHWRRASDLAAARLAGHDISFWIDSGYGAALYDTGNFEASITISERARAWCAAIRQPLPALTIARAHIALGAPARATALLIEAYDLVGDRIFAGGAAAEAELLRAALAERPAEGAPPGHAGGGTPSA